MLIRSFKSADELENDEYIDCGILVYKRHIFIFVDPVEYENNTVKYGKAVIINESVSKGNKEGTIFHISSDNSVIIRTSVYFCSIIFERSLEIKTSELCVNNAYSKESQTLFDKNKVIQYFTGHYSDILKDDIVTDISLNVIESIVNDVDTTVLPPIFYTELQQYKTVDDVFSLNFYYMDVYSGKEILDNKTRVSFMNINSWDTMRLSIMGIIRKVAAEAHGTFDLADLLHSSFTNFLGNNTFFVYDSDGNGINKPGVNIVEGKIPLAQWYTPNHISDNVTTALTLFEQGCRDLEEMYGHIRVNCYTDKIGEKMNIKFKDYITPPKEIKALSGSNSDGEKMSVDTGYHIERAIEDTIDQISQEMNCQSEYYK
jgi:hypothetical protein